MKNFFRIVALFRPYGWWLLASILISLASLLANIGLLAVSGWFIAAMAAAGLASAPINYFTPAAVIRALAILRTGGRYLDRLIGHEATFRLIGGLRAQIFAKLEPLAPAALGDLRSGDVLERLRGDIDRLEQVFLRLISPLAVALLAAAALVVLFARWSFLLAAAALIVFALAGLAAPIASAWSGRRPSRSAAALAADMRARLVDDLEGLAPLLATGAEKRHFGALEKIMSDGLAAEDRIARIDAFGQMGVGASGELAALAVLAFGVPLLRSGAIPGPDLALGVLAALACLEAFAAIPGAFAGLFGVAESADRLFGLMDRRPLVVEPSASASPPKNFDIVFRRVSLTYPGADRPALRNIDLKIPEGARVAFIGTSGAGKSSLADLLIRFRDPTEGEIFLGGVALQNLAGDFLRARIAVIRQNPHLFAATVAENLLLARPGATKEELWDALAAVGLDEIIRALPLGLDSHVGVGGARLSGGQAKRLGLARALLTDAPILFLDEPTEGLDPETARRTLDALIERTKGRTLVLATHRYAELKKMDEIITLDGGVVIENRRGLAGKEAFSSEDRR